MTKPANWTIAFPEQVRVKPIRRIDGTLDTRRSIRAREYKKAKAVWWEKVKMEFCPVMLAIFGLFCPVSPSPHHIRGRLGSLLCDTRYWLACSEAGHRWIHDNPSEARKHGWLAQPGDWNRQPEK